MQIEVYTDGSATVLGKPGGWAYILIVDKKKYAECSGHSESATNNDMELEAAIQGLAAALKYINENANMISNPVENVTLCSDSELVLGWTSGQYRFKQQDKMDKYKQLQFLVKRMEVKTEWIKGHSGNEHNERCDKLANQARLGIKKAKEKQAIAEGKTLIGTKKSGTLCVWYKNCLKIIDLETNVIEDYSREVHGQRGGTLEIREDKVR